MADQPYTWVPDETTEEPQLWDSANRILPTALPTPQPWHPTSDAERRFFELFNAPPPDSGIQFPDPAPEGHTVTIPLDEAKQRLLDVMNGEAPAYVPTPPPLPPPPLYAITTVFPQPPRYEWDADSLTWVKKYDPPLPDLTPRKADVLNRAGRKPYSLVGEDPEWDLSIVEAGVCPLEDANLLTSDALGRPGIHRVAIDIDLPAKLLPSSTPGHSHLYIDVDIPWDKYKRLLEVLADCDIIERGYARASIKRGYTSVRPPWVPKREDERGDSG